MSLYLPCGVTDSMCEPDDPSCASCGQLYSDHYYADGDEYFILQDTLQRSNTSDGTYNAEGIWYYPDGEVENACMLKNSYCEGFVEGEYEPDYDDYRGDLD
jgi:hypothetical protein